MTEPAQMQHTHENEIRIDYDAARARLASITTDPAMLAGIDRIRETGDLDDALSAH